MLNLSKIYKPEIFQGENRKKSYFEGWYFKHVVNNGETVFSLIPGIAFDKNGNGHSFIQYINGKNAQTQYYKFPVDSFIYDSNSFEIQIAINRFSKDNIFLQIDQEPKIHAEINYKDHISIESSIFSPGIMGWYSFLPFMQCYHGLVSLDNRIEGFIQTDNKIVDLTGGKGYIEKDWGESFPKSWLWLQCNTFDEETTSFFFSIAHIPWMGNFFIGYISVFLYKGKVYRFATYNESKINKIELKEDQANIILKNNDIELKVEAKRKNGGILKAPVLGNMERRIIFA
jgi:hypothetical protein